jgi:hypothetical protein
VNHIRPADEGSEEAVQYLHVIARSLRSSIAAMGTYSASLSGRFNRGIFARPHHVLQSPKPSNTHRAILVSLMCSNLKEFVMANKEQRGNREKRKQKKEKPKPPAQASSFSQGIYGSKSTAGRKR